MRRVRLVAAAALSLALAGCAPHVVAPPALERSTIESKFRSELQQRRTRAALADGEWSLWGRAKGAERPPGVSARLVLEAPDGMRVRVNGFLGTALDASLRGDSLVLDAPALDVSGVGAVREPGGGEITAGSLACRALAATWEPPASAWANATLGDSALELRWPEGPDSVALFLDGQGRPREARLRLARGADVRVRYLRWSSYSSVPFPARVEIADAGERWRALCQVESLVLKGAPAQPVVTLRARPGAVELTERTWRRLLSRIPDIVGGTEADPDSDSQGEP